MLLVGLWGLIGLQDTLLLKINDTPTDAESTFDLPTVEPGVSLSLSD